MNRVLSVTAVALLASGLVGAIAFAQKPAGSIGAGAAVEDVTVSASRSRVDANTTRWPKAGVQSITFSYGINAASYDLTTAAGVAGFEQLVNATAADVCQEVFSKYPAVKPDDGECAKTATADAMIKVHELVAAAQKKVGK